MFSKYNRQELYAIAKRLEIKGRSYMNKLELHNAVHKHIHKHKQRGGGQRFSCLGVSSIGAPPPGQFSYEHLKHLLEPKHTLDTFKRNLLEMVNGDCLYPEHNDSKDRIAALVKLGIFTYDGQSREKDADQRAYVCGSFIIKSTSWGNVCSMFDSTRMCYAVSTDTHHRLRTYTCDDDGGARVVNGNGHVKAVFNYMPGMCVSYDGERQHTFAFVDEDMYNLKRFTPGQVVVDFMIWDPQWNFIGDHIETILKNAYEEYNL
jgi:hypothetical protein